MQPLILKSCTKVPQTARISLAIIFSEFSMFQRQLDVKRNGSKPRNKMGSSEQNNTLPDSDWMVIYHDSKKNNHQRNNSKRMGGTYNQSKLRLLPKDLGLLYTCYMSITYVYIWILINIYIYWNQNIRYINYLYKKALYDSMIIH